MENKEKLEKRCKCTPCIGVPVKGQEYCISHLEWMEEFINED